MKFRWEAAERRQRPQGNERSRPGGAAGLGRGERGTQGDRPMGQERPKEGREMRQSPRKHFYFSSLKNRKQTLKLYQLTGNVRLPKALLGQEIRKPER